MLPMAQRSLSYFNLSSFIDLQKICVEKIYHNDNICPENLIFNYIRVENIIFQLKETKIFVTRFGTIWHSTKNFYEYLKFQQPMSPTNQKFGKLMSQKFDIRFHVQPISEPVTKRGNPLHPVTRVASSEQTAYCSLEYLLFAKKASKYLIPS